MFVRFRVFVRVCAPYALIGEKKMFDKNEFSILLRSLEFYREDAKVSCIYCDLVDNRADYAKTKYCVEYCSVFKDIDEIDSLIFKIKEASK